MREFTKSNQITYNLISYTGFKSLLLFEYLLKGPKTFEEIQNFYLNHEHLHELISFDTIRVYMTSLRRCGCDIQRVKRGNGSAYGIVSHPFEFKLTASQIKGIIKIYRVLAETVDVKALLEYDLFIRKLADNINSDELKDSITKNSLFKNIDIDILNKLIDCVKDNKKVVMKYNSPRSGEKEITLIAKDLEFTQNNLYLHAISYEYNQETSYVVSKISAIVSASKENTSNIELNYTTVGYELSTLASGVKLSDNEHIVEIKEDSVIIEATTSNLFMLKRKILEYGALCTVLYPDDFRQEIIDTLKTMRERYANG